MNAGIARPAKALRLFAPVILIAAAAVAVGLYSWDHFSPNAADAAGAGMSLNVVGASSCDDPTKPTTCDVPVANAFTLLINSNPSPSVVIAGFSSEVVIPSGLTYTRSTCLDEVQVGRLDGNPLSICQSFDTVPLGAAGISVLASVSFPVLPLDVSTNSITTLVELDVTCTDPGSHKLILTASPSFPAGANYSDTLASEIHVKTIQQDVDGDTSPDDVADTLIVNCTTPPTATLTPTATATPTPLPPTTTPLPTDTPTATSTSTPTGDSQLSITKISSAVLVGGACFEVFLFPGPGSFQVCDNNTQPLDSHAVCLEDGTSVCEDTNAESGVVSVAVVSGFYDVVETIAPFNHMLDTSLQLCDPRPGGGCTANFEDETTTNPSFPWDINGDGEVAFGDFLQLLQHFGQTKP